MTTLEAPALRSQRLNLATHAPHQRLDAAVKAHDPFASRENFTPFVVAQYLFQSELQALYQDAELGAIFPDLPERCRARQAKADLADLGAQVPAPVAGALANPSRAEALGWLFVSEGSKLGAAFLIKRVAALGLDENFGARHLGEPAGGRAEEWKTAEPSGEDQPEVTAVPDEGYGRGEPNGVGSAHGEQFSRFGRYIGMSALPGDRDAVLKSARDLEAPDDVLARLAALPPGTTYRTVAEIWHASQSR